MWIGTLLVSRINQRSLVACGFVLLLLSFAALCLLMHPPGKASGVGAAGELSGVPEERTSRAFPL